MDDLISRKAILGYPLRRGNAGCDEANANPHFLNGVESVMEYALDLPTVAAEPVRHGRWVHKNNSKTCKKIGDFEEWLVCSACDMEVECEYPNCPYCTARMDAKEGAE